MKKACPISVCSRVIQDRMAMCLDHWKLVPKDLQGIVYDAYRGGDGIGTDELREAREKAIDAVERHLAKGA